MPLKQKNVLSTVNESCLLTKIKKLCKLQNFLYLKIEGVKGIKLQKNDLVQMFLCVNVKNVKECLGKTEKFFVLY
jgi:hypothetical protein